MPLSRRFRWSIVSPTLMLLTLFLGGCQSQHPLATSSTDLMGDLSPVGSFTVERRQPFVLPFDASIYIANPVNGLVTDDGLDINSRLVDTFKQGFSQNFASVFVAVNKERLPVSLGAARQMNANFLVYPFIERWANIDPIRVKQCEELGGKGCGVDSDDDESGDSRVSVAIYESVSGKLVDMISIKSKRGIAAYFYEDNDKVMHIITRSVLDSLSEKR